VRCFFYHSNLEQIKDKLIFVICFSEAVRRKGGLKKRLRKLGVFGEYRKFYSDLFNKNLSPYTLNENKRSKTKRRMKLSILREMFYPNKNNF
jgi:hypothetical protein